ncbi:MAG: aldo/keto reductase [Clostridia bacterium]|nr:aldo/keto reductase [Clostridia bacterium]
MRYQRCKHTELMLSNVVLGTDGFGSSVEQERAYALLDAYTDAGGNALDTAECYSKWIPGGDHASENLLGKWIKEKKNRQELFLSTKGGFYSYGMSPRLSREEIFADLEGSLRRLGTDYVDIYWLHRDAPTLPVEDMMDTLALAVRQGKVRYIGVSNWDCRRFHEANAYCQSMGYPMLVGSQLQYSPATPNPEQNEPDLILMNEREYEYFKEQEFAVFAYAAQAKGFFSQYEKGGKDALSVKAFSRYYNEKTVETYTQLKRLAEEKECSIGAMVIAALANQYDFDTFPIVGCKTVEQLYDSLSGADIVLTEEEWRTIKKDW